MARQIDELSSSWFERAIVLSSEAESAVGRMDDSPVRFNDRARRVIRKRADDAAADLRSAMGAYVTERRQAQERLAADEHV